jgi:ribosomal-protein-alanine N-acetyltransferase
LTIDDRKALQTARLTLEPILPDHADALFGPLQDARLYSFIPQEPPASLAALRERFARLAVGRSPDGTQVWLNWAARRIDSGARVGTYQATVYPGHTADIAYITFAGQQGQGFAREACVEVIRYLREGYGVQTVGADIDARNQASIALIERLGFTRLRTTKNADFFKGASSDEYRYEMNLG